MASWWWSHDTVHKVTRFACWGHVNEKKDISKVDIIQNIMEDENPILSGIKLMQIYSHFEGFPVKFKALLGLVM